MGLDTSFLELRILLKELSGFCGKVRVENVYQMEDGSLILKLRGYEERVELRIVPGVCLYWVRGGYEKPMEPTEHARRFRKFLAGASMERVELVAGERIAVFHFRRGKNQYRLVVELLPRGTIVLLDPQDKIIEPLHRISFRDRRIAPGEVYRPPPPIQNIIEVEDVDELLKSLSKGKKVVAALASEAGLGGRYAEEAVKLAEVDGSKKVSELSADEWGRILEAVKEIGRRAEEGKPVVAESPEGDVQALPYSLETLSEKGWRMERAESLNDAFRIAYERTLAKSIAEERIKKTLEEARKLEEEAGGKRYVASRLMEKASSLRRQGRLLLTRSHEIEEAKAKKPEEPLNLGGGLRVKVEPGAGTLLVETPEGEVKLKLERTVAKQASNLFDDAKKAEEAARKLLKEAQILEDKAERLKRGEKDLVEEVLERVTARLEKPEKKWYERYRWFETSEGFIAVAGKDASSNRALLRKHLEDRDLVFHAEVRGAPILILKNGKDAGERSRIEAAQFAASYSRAWKEGIQSITVYYVEPGQVSLTAPSGHYIPRGGVIIKGEKHYLTIKLELGFGLRDGEVVWGPPSALFNKVEKVVRIVPGKRKAGDVAEKVAERLLTGGERKEREALSRKIEQLIPYGSAEIA